MTIPKDAGLSHLADVANEQALTFHYPIKKKREPRRLRPNLDAIRYLEIEQEHPTAIFEEFHISEAQTDGEVITDFKVQRANGWFDAKRANMYPRPMFQALPLSASSSMEVRYPKPCPACDDWSRTARCEEHHDRDGVAGLSMGGSRRIERAERAGQVLAYASPDRAASMADYFRTVLQDSLGNISRRNEALANQSLLYSAEVRDPNAGRPGYHYHFGQDRWIPDTDDALGDFRAGAVRGRDVTYSEVSADERLATEWERQNGIGLAEVLSQIDRVPDRLLGPTRERWLDRIEGLPSGSIEITNATIEVNGETLQGVQSFTIHIQGDPSA